MIFSGCSPGFNFERKEILKILLNDHFSLLLFCVQTFGVRRPLYALKPDPDRIVPDQGCISKSRTSLVRLTQTYEKKAFLSEFGPKKPDPQHWIKQPTKDGP